MRSQMSQRQLPSLLALAGEKICFWLESFSFSAFNFLFACHCLTLFLSAQLITVAFCIDVISALTPRAGLQTLRGHNSYRVKQTKQHIHSTK